jgi:hypothetical protein
MPTQQLVCLDYSYPHILHSIKSVVQRPRTSNFTSDHKFRSLHIPHSTSSFFTFFSNKSVSDMHHKTGRRTKYHITRLFMPVLRKISSEQKQRIYESERNLFIMSITCNDNATKRKLRRKSIPTWNFNISIFFVLCFKNI